MFYPYNMRELKVSIAANGAPNLPAERPCRLGAAGSCHEPAAARAPARAHGEGREAAAEPASPGTYSKCLISVLKLARAAWWTPFLVIKSSFSSASVSSVRFTFPSKLKSKACKTTLLEENELSSPAAARRHLFVK